MSTLPPSEANYLADEQKNRINFFSIHTGATGTTGANEAFGGNYERQPATWNVAGAVGPLGSSYQPATPGVAWAVATFEVNAGTYTDVGFWGDTTTATFRGGDDMAATQTLESAGTIPNISIAVGPGVATLP